MKQHIYIYLCSVGPSHQSKGKVVEYVIEVCNCDYSHQNNRKGCNRNRNSSEEAHRIVSAQVTEPSGWAKQFSSPGATASAPGTNCISLTAGVGDSR